jgi:hypothetical protein
MKIVSKQATWQCNKVLEWLKTMNDHASWNLLNEQQNLVDGTLINLSPFPSPYFNPPFNDSNGPSIEVTSLDPYTLMTIFIKMLTPI